MDLIIDDFMDEHIAQLIHGSIHNTDFSWNFHYKANEKEPDMHWHKLAGHSIEEMSENGFDYLIPLWESIQNLDGIPETKIIRCYLNAHTYGIEPTIHRDDGTYTFIYYPNLSWQDNWGGGTSVYEEDLKEGWLATYKPNRLIGFDAKKLHQGMPVTRKCFALRTCVVFKTE